jgi:hypothetical protein
VTVDLRTGNLVDYFRSRIYSTQSHEKRDLANGKPSNKSASSMIRVEVTVDLRTGNLVTYSNIYSKPRVMRRGILRTGNLVDYYPPVV